MTGAEWNVCIFEPVDVVVATDARPLPPEGGGWSADGEPFPGAFAGAMRTAVLRHAGFDFEVLRGRKASVPPNAALIARAIRLAGYDVKSHHDGFRFAAPLLYTATAGSPALLFAPPAFLLRGAPNRRLVVDDSRVLTDPALGGVRLLRAPGKGDELEEMLMGAEYLCGVLRGQATPRGSIVDRDRVYRIERRTGHARSEHGTVLDGQLFSRSGRRFHEEWHAGISGYAGLVVADAPLAESTSSSDASSLTVRLGADGHTVRVRFHTAKTEQQPIEALREAVLGHAAVGQHVLVYLATPAVYEAGWRPSLPLEKCGLRLVAAAVGRPRVLAGWDLVQRAPKPIRRAVPAGSCYIYEVVDAARAKATIERFHCNHPLTDVDGDQGCGLALWGVWNAPLPNVGKG